MPDVDEELEEIKRLIADDSTYARSPSKELVPSRSGPGVPVPARPAAPKKQEQELSVRPAQDKPAVAAKPAQNKPAVSVKPAQNKPAVTGKPTQNKPAVAGKAAQNKPAVAGKPESKELSAAPAPKKRVPAPFKKPGPLGAAEDFGQVRSFDISPDGKVTKKPDKEPKLDTGSEKFKINFDFDSEYMDVPEDRPLRFRREKRTGCIGGILYSAFVICISLVLASLLWMATVDVLGFGAEDEQINVTVPLGFTMEDITDMLFEAGIIRYKFLFDIYADYSSAEGKITAGSYVLNKNYDYRAIVTGMTARGGVRVETSVMIPEGFTLAQIFALMEDYGVCPASDLWEAATNHNFSFHFLDEETLGDRLRLEGFLFPDTHNFYLDSTPVQVLNKLLREFDRRFTDAYIERAEIMGYSVRDIINIAAMIEREAGSDEERPRIAAVIYNRLESRNFPYLQIDATIHYALQGTGRPFPVPPTDFDHPFNTYTNEGLPPGPIANPGMQSIRAALYPDSTNEYYYALNREGTHNFFRTLEQHNAFVRSDQYGGR